PYDWRKDNFEAAGRLADKLDEIVTIHGNNSEISLVAHSMGGLVARAYLESGSFDNRPGHPAVKLLLTLGTPHRGAPMALLAALGKEKRLFLSRDQVAQVANDPRYTALYQLLPPRHEPFAWDRTVHARASIVDVYDPQTASRLGLRLENLLAATQ